VQIQKFVDFLSQNPERYLYDTGYAHPIDESGNVTEIINRISFVDKSLVKRDSSSCYSVLSKDCTFGVTKEWCMYILFSFKLLILLLTIFYLILILVSLLLIMLLIIIV